MNIHEYQAKQLLKKYGVKVLEGRVVFSSEEALNAATEKNDLTKIYKLLDTIEHPYKNSSEISSYQYFPASKDKIYKTFCGT